MTTLWRWNEGARVIPARIRDTLTRALRARISLAEYFADLPLAQQHMAEAQEALRWLDGLEVEHSFDSFAAPQGQKAERP